MNKRYIVAACWAFLAPAGLQAQPAQPAQPSPSVDAAAFINAGGLEDPRLSPNGERLAGMVRNNSVRALVTQKIDGSDRKVVFAEDKPETALDFVRWVGDDRVLLRLWKSDGMKLGSQALPVSRLISIKMDAGQPKVLSPRYAGSGGTPNHMSHEGRLTCPSSPFVTLKSGEYGRTGSELLRFDARTGVPMSDVGVEGAMRRWWSDSEGQARLFQLQGDGKAQWRWLPASRKTPVPVDWPVLASYPEWQVLGFDGQPDQVLVLAQRDGKWQVLRVNVNEPTAAQTVAELDTTKAPEALELVRNETTCQAVGLRHSEGTLLWGDNLIPFWGGLAQAVPNAKLELVQWQGDRILVRMSEAGLPTRYLLGLRSARKLDVVAETYSRLPGDLGLSQHPVEVGPYKATWLQRSDSTGPLPTVLCIACELNRRGPDGSYLPLAAYLAYRGFGVLNVNHESDDTPLLDRLVLERQSQTAALAEVARLGWSNPHRMAVVAGHSTASWLAMAFAGAHQPQVRAVAVSGLVSDMGRYAYREILGVGFISEGTKAGVRRLVGKATEAELSAASPMAMAPQWQAPLLLVHAESHGSVNVTHSQRLADALKAAGKPVTLLRLPNTTEELAHPPYRTQVIKAIDELLAPLLLPSP
jgi:acetyl esterase/lipase